jgi:hypothetical protein
MRHPMLALSANTPSPQGHYHLRQLQSQPHVAHQLHLNLNLKRSRNLSQPPNLSFEHPHLAA